MLMQQMEEEADAREEEDKEQKGEPASKNELEDARRTVDGVNASRSAESDHKG